MTSQSIPRPIETILQEMRDRKVNGNYRSPTLIAWADEIAKARAVELEGFRISALASTRRIQVEGEDHVQEIQANGT